MGYMEFLQDNPGKGYYHTPSYDGQNFLVYHNTSSIPMKLGSIGIRAATGSGTFTAGQRVSGNGAPITLTATGAAPVTISEVITPTKGYPNFTDPSPNYTIVFNNVIVPANSSYTIALNLSGGSCFCVWFGTSDNPTANISIGESPAVATVTWNALPGETKWREEDAWTAAVTNEITIGDTAAGKGPWFVKLRGYHFDKGWIDDNGNTPSIIYGNIAYHIDWTINTSTINIDLNGGSSSVYGEHTQNFDTQLEIPIPTGPLVTVNFNGNGGLSNLPTTQLNRPFDHWDKNDDFHGVLENNIYTFGEYDKVTDNIKAQYQNAIFTFPTATKDQYLLYGWCDNTKGDGTIYQPGDTVGLDSDKTYYALWVTAPIWEHNGQVWRKHLPSTTTRLNVDCVWRYDGNRWIKDRPIYKHTGQKWEQLKGYKWQ